MKKTQKQTASIHCDLPYAGANGDILVVKEPPEGLGDATRNFDVDTRSLPVANARLMDRPAKLDREGFAVVNHNSSFDTFDSADEIRRSYYPEAEQIVMRATGASKVMAFDHNIRTVDATGDRRKPANIIHVDVTEQSALRIATEQIPAFDASKFRNRRTMFVNTWRPLANPVYDSHLAFCDASTVPMESLLRAELRYTDRTGELYYCAFHEAHRWYYFPQVDPTEVLLLKNYDSATDGRARYTPHTAIKDPSAPKNVPARESIEVRTIAFF